jgi:hypothetical protein
MNSFIFKRIYCEQPNDDDNGEHPNFLYDLKREEPVLLLFLFGHFSRFLNYSFFHKDQTKVCSDSEVTDNVEFIHLVQGV